MVRDIGKQRDAPGIIISNLLDKTIEIDRENEYVLFYWDDAFFERYASYPNVKRVKVNAFNKFVWDQLAIPLAVRREKIDLHSRSNLYKPFSCPNYAGHRT